MTQLLSIIVIITLLSECGKAPDEEGVENPDNIMLYEKCHDHDTYGAHIGYQRYCMVPIERMDEMNGSANERP